MTTVSALYSPETFNMHCCSIHIDVKTRGSHAQSAHDRRKGAEWLTAEWMLAEWIAALTCPVTWHNSTQLWKHSPR